MKRLNTSEFIRRAKEVHGDKYYYSNTDYVNIRTKVIISCPIHGDFLQGPEQHVKRGQGCPACGNVYRYKEINDWECKFRQVHPESNLIFDNSIYVNKETKMKVKCPVHGNFKSRPGYLLQSGCCPKCGIERRSELKKLTTEYVVDECKKVHGKKYDYSKTVYKNRNTKMNVDCPVHGEFFIHFADHVKGVGCGRCYGNQGRIAEDWILNFRQRFPDSDIDFSVSKFKKGESRGVFKCPKHGMFERRYDELLKGRHCPSCADPKYGFSANSPAIFYYAQVKHKGNEYWKIGISNRTFEKRYYKPDLSKMQLLFSISFDEGAKARSFESSIKSKYSQHLYVGKDKILKGAYGNTEVFTMNVLGV